ncbi:uncharacterized protein LOC133197002 [Saccostrea echinata]|uniref:uncharacterized protein LOC133197002 n=1 Tax=Saccostrea echinata TaxID=191078 RepID=UPI002A82CE76|nr:uncharacterized protein LOC133197002 [Saccostrea echinata]
MAVQYLTDRSNSSFKDSDPVVESVQCYSGYCFHSGTCTNSPNATCTCTVGFVGGRCKKNGMKAFRNELNNTWGYNNTKASEYVGKVKQILQEHIFHQYELIKTVNYTNEVLDIIATEMRNQTRKKYAMKNADFLPLTEDYVEILTTIVTILNDKGCGVGQTVNCSVNATLLKYAFQYSTLLSYAEDNLVQITSIMGMTRVEEGEMTTIEKDGIISFTILKSKGKDLPFVFQAAYGSVTLPYWETFQDTIGGRTIVLSVLTYHKSPYGFVDNLDAVASGVIKVVTTDKNGKILNLRDRDDPVDMTVDMTQVFSATHTWSDMERLADGRSTCVAFRNETYSAFVLELKINSFSKCTMYGIYGTTGYPTSSKRDILVKTKGMNLILDSKPYGLPVTFDNQLLQITIYNTNYWKGGHMDPLAITLRCEDDVAKRKKRQAFSNVHQFRVQEITLSQLGSTTWADSNSAEIDKAEGNNIKFKSTFFGTFASNTLFIPPATIDFEAIFTNFLERLRLTPHVLIIFVILFVLIVILTIFLRRMDISDHLIWDYLPLADNKRQDSYKYTISVFTAIRSSRLLTSTPYFVLEGSKGSTGDRILFDGQRQNFSAGTCSNFFMSTENELGKLKRLTMWTDNKGRSPDWMLSKVVIIDLSTKESYTFLCGEWISQQYGNCDTWVVLEPLSKGLLVRETIFTETARKGFFDDHLWFSISKRPHYSQFTRVQRLWTLMALLFLSMVASAMWFNQEPSKEDQDPDTVSAIRTVQLGPFKLSYKQLYVGFMSSLITFVPSIIIVAIFKNRKIKQENTSYSDSQKESEIVSIENKKRRLVLPWQSVYFAYALIGLCITTGGTFTFLYSLEFGTDKTNDWLMSFVFGTVLGVLILEPVKVLLFAILIACCLQRSKETLSDVGNPYQNVKEDDVDGECDDVVEAKIIYHPCPIAKANTRKSQMKKKRFKLDNELAEHFKSFLLCIFYIFILAMICSHITTTTAFRQNEAMSISINNSFVVNTTDDIWTWLIDYYINATWTKYFVNDDLRTAYEQRFTYDGYNYRMSLIQLRQVRSYGNCSGPKVVQNVVTRCTNDYDIETESTENFCPGWEKFNSSCFDENEIIDYSFQYKSSKELKSFSYLGKYAYYGGGGYRMQLGPKQSLVINHVNQLRSKTWIDGNTRAIFVDSNTFNANSRLFTHLKVVFEISEYGAITMTTISKSSNLYPYVYALDYIILCLQIIFVIIIVVKMILFGINVFKLKRKCFVTFGMWITLAEIVLALLAIVFFIIRIDKTIKAVDDINDSNGAFVSFEEVELYDEIYRLCIAGVFFIVILRLLQPLSFNYHLFVLEKSLSKARTDLISYSILLSISLTAFASYLYLTLGRYVFDFKSMDSALGTLLQMLLSMISFRFNVDMSSMQAQVVVSLFAFTVSIIGINIFIGILTWNFYYIKLLQTDKEATQNVLFNQELNDHFWWRVDQVLRRLIFRRTPKSKNNDALYKKVEKKIDCIDQKFNDITKEEIEWTFSTTAMMFICKKDHRRNLLGCCITAHNNDIQYRFFDQMTKSTKVVLTLPYLRPGDAPEIICYEVPLSLFILSGFKIPHSCSAKTDMFEFIINGDLQTAKCGSRITFKDGSILAEDIVHCSYDNMRTWQTKLLREEESLGVYCCKFHSVPSHCFVVHRQESIKLDIGELHKFPDLERHRLLKSDQCIRLRSDKRIGIAISANAVQENGDIIIMVEKPFAALCPILQLYSTRKINGTIDICLPLKHQPTSNIFNGVTREFWVLIREKNATWKKTECQVELDFDRIVVCLRLINMKTPTAICVKEVLLPWGQLQSATQDWKFVREINQLSQNAAVQKHWRDLAEKCKVTFTSKFEDHHIPYFISVENRKYVFNMDRCLFRRITAVPISDQEKFLTILSTWLKGLKSKTGVTSLIPLLREYNLPYLPDL